LRAVARNEQSTFRLEYEHHGPFEQRFFQLRISRFGDGDTLRVVVAHEDVTDVRRFSIALEQMTERLLHSQEDERRRIARELHDSTAQNLVAAALNKARLDRLVQPLGGDAPDLVTEIGELIEQALREIRNFAYLLHPPLLEEIGLCSALRSYVSGFAKRSGLDVKIKTPAGTKRLPAELERGIFRVTQEALANIHRHSGGSRARILLRKSASHVVLEVNDNGRGMKVDAGANGYNALPSAGVGIPGMQARIRQLGGTLEISSDARGTRLKAIVPLKPIDNSRTVAAASVLSGVGHRHRIGRSTFKCDTEPEVGAGSKEGWPFDDSHCAAVIRLAGQAGFGRAD
jgi:two-component system NarL family sensor kinase